MTTYKRRKWYALLVIVLSTLDFRLSTAKLENILIQAYFGTCRKSDISPVLTYSTDNHRDDFSIFENVCWCMTAVSGLLSIVDFDF